MTIIAKPLQAAATTKGVEQFVEATGVFDGTAPTIGGAPATPVFDNTVGLYRYGDPAELAGKYNAPVVKPQQAGGLFVFNHSAPIYIAGLEIHFEAVQDKWELFITTLDGYTPAKSVDVLWVDDTQGPWKDYVQVSERLILTPGQNLKFVANDGGALTADGFIRVKFALESMFTRA